MNRDNVKRKSNRLSRCHVAARNKLPWARALTKAELFKVALIPEIVRDGAGATELGRARPPGALGQIAILKVCS